MLSSSLRPRRVNSDIIRAFPILLSGDIDPEGGGGIVKGQLSEGGEEEEKETRGPFK